MKTNANAHEPHKNHWHTENKHDKMLVSDRLMTTVFCVWVYDSDMSACSRSLAGASQNVCHGHGRREVRVCTRTKHPTTVDRPTNPIRDAVRRRPFAGMLTHSRECQHVQVRRARLVYSERTFSASSQVCVYVKCLNIIICIVDDVVDVQTFRCCEWKSSEQCTNSKVCTARNSSGERWRCTSGGHTHTY